MNDRGSSKQDPAALEREDVWLNWDDARDEERKALDPEATERPLSALCLSGGGIRSATFALGALQGLARQSQADGSLLEQFDYLSTVSGGGYIGSWLTAWKHRRRGLPAVVESLRRVDEGPEVHHLREYNSYMAPRAGGLSSDTWTVMATAVRNMLLNWLVMIPLLMGGLMLPRLFLKLQSIPESQHPNLFPESSVPRVSGNISSCRIALPCYADHDLNHIANNPLIAYVAPLAALLLFAIAFYNILRSLPGLGDAKSADATSVEGEAKRNKSGYQYQVAAPLIFAILLVFTYENLYYVGDNFTPTPLWHVLLAVGIPYVLALLAFISRRRWTGQRRLRNSSKLLVAVGVMALGTGLAMWVVTEKVLWSPNPTEWVPWPGFVTFGPLAYGLCFVLSMWLFVGLTSHWLHDADREWMSRASAGVLRFSVMWAAVCALVLIVPEWALAWRTWGPGLFAGATAVVAWVSTRGGSVTVDTTSGAQRDALVVSGRSGKERQPSRLVSRAVLVSPVIFLGLLLVVLSIVTDQVIKWALTLAKEDHYSKWDAMLSRSAFWTNVYVALLFLVVGAVMALRVNINVFSLHAMYRDRLTRAYLGASNLDRRPDPFTDFSTTDDIPMGGPNGLRPDEKPFHVLNLTLNLVHGTRLDWQQRKAESFTVTPLHTGNRTLGYRRSEHYADGISLGTAAALSGAAVSPNMGAASSPILGFIMTLFNLRLGAWLGNPKSKRGQPWKRSGPRYALGPMGKEAMGLTGEDSRYVYLSDGGHFENLGLYEMVRRRCRHVVVLDASADPDLKCKELGNALRKIRIDLGVSIDFEDGHLSELRNGARRWAVARIGYGGIDNADESSWLIYIKPVLAGNEPPDVTSYSAAHPTFPHQSTSDQNYDESQTESYRELGELTIEELCSQAKDGGWEGTLSTLGEHLRRERPGTNLL